MLNNDHNFVLQWNITNQCEYSCKYCYLKSNKQDSVTLLNEDIILKQIHQFRINFKNFYVNITGGNPLLHPNFEHIVKELFNNDIHVRILGNPLTNDKHTNIIKQIAEYIDYYQISIDGNCGNVENRNSNDLNQRWKTIRLLQSLGVKTCVMLTLTDANIDEVISVLSDCVKMNVGMFAFSRVVRDTSFNDNCSNKYSIIHYKELLDNVFKYLVDNDINIFSFKDTLWTLYLYEKGLIQLDSSEVSGCGAGIYTLSIMPNGIVQPCSRLSISLGNLSRNSLMDIWKYNPILLALRDFDKYEKCSDCRLVSVCRGCRAIAYAESNSLFSKDPYCWKY